MFPVSSNIKVFVCQTLAVKHTLVVKHTLNIILRIYTFSIRLFPGQFTSQSFSFSNCVSHFFSHILYVTLFLSNCFCYTLSFTPCFVTFCLSNCVCHTFPPPNFYTLSVTFSLLHFGFPTLFVTRYLFCHTLSIKICPSYFVPT